MRTTVALSLAWSLLAGCAIETSAGRERTAEPLSLDTREETTSHAYRQDVGTVQIRDERGARIGSATAYQDRVDYSTRVRWAPMQGQERIADEDFFRFTGDPGAAAASRAYRRTGWILAVGGASLAALALGALITSKSLPDDHAARTPLGVGGVLGVLAGPIASFYGFGHLNPENHAVSRRVAEESLRTLQSGERATPSP